MPSPFIVGWFTELGVNFDRHPDGSYFTHMPAGHSRKRSHSIKDLTGLEIMRVLGDEIRNRKIDVLECSPAVELLLDAIAKGTNRVRQYSLDTELVIRSSCAENNRWGLCKLRVQES